MKKILLLLIIFFLTGCQSNRMELNGLENDIINKEILKIKKIEKAYFKENNKYLQIPEYTKGAITYEVHEYVMPNGDAGYQIYVKGVVRDSRIKKSVGYGPLSNYRNMEIVLPTHYLITTSTEDEKLFNF